MNREEIIKLISLLGENAEVRCDEELIEVTILDGYDEDRDYDEELLDSIVTILNRTAKRIEGDLYKAYIFDDCVVEFGLESYDLQVGVFQPIQTYYV